MALMKAVFRSLLKSLGLMMRLKISLRKLIEAQQLERENKELMKALRSQNQMLSQASEKAASEIQQKERLFATISHEIRNPLHGIQGILELLSRDSDGSDQKLLSTAITSAGFMRQILDDVLDYSKVEAGKDGASKGCLFSRGIGEQTSSP